MKNLETEFSRTPLKRVRELEQVGVGVWGIEIRFHDQLKTNVSKLLSLKELQRAQS